MKCWGLGDQAQLGQGSTHRIGDDPNEMAGLQAVNLGQGLAAKAIAAGLYHTCALLNNDSMKCWGLNGHSQLGMIGGDGIHGDTVSEMGDGLQAIKAGASRKVVAISAGSWNSCFILDNDDVKCWGRNLNGQLGQGYKTYRDQKGTPNDKSDDVLFRNYLPNDIDNSDPLIQTQYKINSVVGIPPIPLPVNGVCGTERNTCLAGQPNDDAIDDTNSHYKWHCEGSREGVTARDCKAAISVQ